MENVLSVLASAILSGIVATIVTLWWQNRSEKIKLKREIFTTLMAYRFRISHAESVKALNSVQAVFNDCPSVLDAWRAFKGAADKQPYVQQDLIDAHITLLEEIGKILHYKNINWKDIKSSYYPTDLADQIEGEKVLRNAQIQVALGNIEENKRKAAQREPVELL